jgi:hypothetical protein
MKLNTLPNVGDVRVERELRQHATAHNLLVDDVTTVSGASITSIGLSAPTGLTVTGSPLTSNGTLALSYTAGYAIPTTAKQTDWDTAYGWGNHAGLYVGLTGDQTVAGTKTFSSPVIASATGTAFPALSGYSAPLNQVIGTTTAAGTGRHIALAGTTGVTDHFVKSRGSPGSPAVNNNGDTIAQQNFWGHDGTNFLRAVSMVTQVDAAPSTGVVQGRWILSTQNSAGTLTEVMRANSAGAVGIGITTLTGYTLRVARNITGSTTANGVGSDGTVQSDVTTDARGVYGAIGTAAASFTLPNLRQFTATGGGIGVGSTVTNQYGFSVLTGLTGATNNFGFHSNLASASGVWNIYMAGTADNYVAGSLGVGSTSLTGYNLRVSKTLTGAVSSFSVATDSVVQSGVTTEANGFRSGVGTAAAAFTLGVLRHYAASQGTFGATSAVTTQAGYVADATLIGATNNYGFQGLIPSGANRWNLYMEGTAPNYLAGVTTHGAKFGYGTLAGVGGTVTQATDKTTTVVLDKVTGQITMEGTTALNANTTAVFTLTNSTIEADDNIVIHRKSGGTAGAYQVWCDSVAAGSCVIAVRNTTGGNLSEAPVLQFSVIKGAIA